MLAGNSLVSRSITLDFGLYVGADHELNSVWCFYWVPLQAGFGQLLRPAGPLPEASESRTA